ncbi:unnamed protein product [Brassica rapa]|uniref:Uncharacterized protein n=1 Tax=Brassica campestris TaxID=3711 RepID=A0A3P5Z9F4_BRACM|nr:unnamed protein product [Brassica rapa]VDC76492.1 unnamed protein product [Brassica rapa]
MMILSLSRNLIIRYCGHFLEAKLTKSQAKQIAASLNMVKKLLLALSTQVQCGKTLDRTSANTLGRRLCELGDNFNY